MARGNMGKNLETQEVQEIVCSTIELVMEVYLEICEKLPV